MGSTTQQYSEKEIIEMYQETANRYKKIADELEKIKTTEYVTEIGIKCFLNEHLKFCYDAIDVLEDAVKRINTNRVDEFICLRLEHLFDCCAKEHENLEDTYSRVAYEKSSDFLEYESIHCKLREECDGMSCFDETIKFVRAMIAVKTNSIVINGPVNNAQIQ